MITREYNFFFVQKVLKHYKENFENKLLNELSTYFVSLDDIPKGRLTCSNWYYSKPLLLFLTFNI